MSLYEKLLSGEEKLSLVGLGYVACRLRLPLPEKSR